MQVNYFTFYFYFRFEKRSLLTSITVMFLGQFFFLTVSNSALMVQKLYLLRLIIFSIMNAIFMNSGSMSVAVSCYQLM